MIQNSILEINKVFLVGVFNLLCDRNEYKESMDELSHLADTANLNVVNSFIQTAKKINARTYIGKGKLVEIASKTIEAEVTTLIFNDNLTPAQSRNISDFTKCNVIDRTELILDIFTKHAKTKQAKLQVELAQLEYNYSKLKKLWKHLSRIEGGIGFRGPGEKQIEVDRREIKKKTSVLKKKLKEIENNSILKRKNRKDIISIALVGYTNAGKSTIFNCLVHEKRYTADKLFATLDSTTRALNPSANNEVVLTDTIGFIRKLPHNLVSSFHSTLIEVIEADLLLHIIDISQPFYENNIDSVNNVLEEIGAQEKEIITVFNKCDKLEDQYLKFLKKKINEKYPDSLFLIAKENIGFDKLTKKIDEFCENCSATAVLQIPVEMQNLISFVHSQSDVTEDKYDKNFKNRILTVKISSTILPKIEQQIENYRLKKYINK